MEDGANESPAQAALERGTRLCYPVPAGYCVLDELARGLANKKVSTTPKAIREIFAAMPRSRVALKTGITRRG